MIILRLFLVLVVLLLVLSGGMYIFTRDRRYLRLYPYGRAFQDNKAVSRL